MNMSMKLPAGIGLVGLGKQGSGPFLALPAAIAFLVSLGAGWEEEEALKRIQEAQSQGEDRLDAQKIVLALNTLKNNPPQQQRFDDYRTRLRDTLATSPYAMIVMAQFNRAVLVAYRDDPASVDYVEAFRSAIVLNEMLSKPLYQSTPVTCDVPDKR